MLDFKEILGLAEKTVKAMEVVVNCQLVPKGHVE
jgi:hypothetical protein